MGGLWKQIPITYAVMLIGTLAITGVGIPGLDIGFAGFYSKDADHRRRLRRRRARQLATAASPSSSASWPRA